MPKLERDPAPGGPVVQGFAGRRFRVDGAIFAGGLILTPERAIVWSPPALGKLAAEDLTTALMLDPAPEFLLLGTGSAMAWPSQSLIAELEARGIGVEAMDSRAAARAWGILRGEGRWIAAALYPL